MLWIIVCLGFVDFYFVRTALFVLLRKRRGAGQCPPFYFICMDSWNKMIKHQDFLETLSYLGLSVAGPLIQTAK
jgi:hypothetical protein